MSQYISQDLFDRMALALILNSDPRLSDPRTAEQISRFLKEVSEAFSTDDFASELFAAARWFRNWSVAALRFDSDMMFATAQQINQRCQTHFPSGFRRPAYQSDVQPLAPLQGERLATFQLNVTHYLEQLESVGSL